MRKPNLHAVAVLLIVCMVSCASNEKHDIQEVAVIAEPPNDGKLTREKATEILKSQPASVLTSNVQLSDLSLSPGVPNLLKSMEQKGLATYKYIPPGTEGYGCYGQLTEEGKKYLHRVISNEFVSMIMAKIGFDHITGIQEVQTNMVVVEYIEKVVEVTPMGEIHNPSYQLGQTRSAKATFVKYDDGWRIKK